MQIEYIELVLYRRFRLNETKFFSWRPKKKLLQIIGTNGAGKSSLLEELSPLPGYKEFFEKGGRKYVEIRHNGSFYQLESNFENSPKYSFIKDGEELNPGLTITVYKNLVQRDFGLTSDIHELRIGLTNFHALSTADRRKLFSRLNNQDFSYALQYFQRLKDKLNTDTGALKFAQTRLVQETNKLIDPQRKVEIEKQLNDFRIRQSALSELRQPVMNDTEWNKTISQTEYQIKERLKTFYKLTQAVYFPYANTDLAKMENDALECRTSILFYQKNLQQLSESLERLENRRHELTTAGDRSLDDVQRDIRELTEEIDLLYTQLRYPQIHFADSPIDVLNTLTRVIPDLGLLIDALPANPGKEINSTLYQQLKDQRQAAEIQLNQANKGIELNTQLLERLSQLKNNTATTCPKCAFSWVVGYDEVKEQEATTAKAKFEEAKHLISDRIKELDDKLTSMTTYFTSVRNYLAFTEQYRSLKPLWDLIIARDLITNDPHAILVTTDDVKGDMLVYIQILAKRQVITEREKQKELISKNSSHDREQLLETMNRLHEEAASLQREINLCRQKESSLQLKINNFKSLTQVRQEITELQALHTETANNIISNHINYAVASAIHALTTEIHSLEQLLYKETSQRHLVDSISRDIASLTDQIQLTKIALKELSPSEGLIAKGMTGFINHFLQHVNAFIGKHWLYPLEIKPIAFNEDEQDLDYKFKLGVGHNDQHPVPDISMGSSAQREIIDLAFTVISSLYLGLKEFPLYVDEFARGFDDAHRTEAIRIIQDLLNNSNFSQIFMISHYNNMYGSLHDAEIVVLCSANLSLPENCVYNENVIIR